MTLTTSTDEQLMERFAAGDVASLGALASRHEAALVGLARSLLHGREDLARDAVQDAWVKVIKHAKGFRGGSSFKTWMYRIVINTSHDLRAKHARTGMSIGPEAEHVLDAPHVDQPWAHNGTLLAAVDALPSGTRLILMLGYHHDLTHEQIADVLDIPVGTVKSRLHAALVRLRERLGPEVKP